MMIANAQNMHTATVTAERPYGIRVRLKASDPFTLLMGKEWEKAHWFATAMERDQRLAAMSAITGRDIGSTNDLTAAEGKHVMDTLSRCRDRGALIERLAVAQETP
jgi:hypothetical protein